MSFYNAVPYTTTVLIGFAERKEESMDTKEAAKKRIVAFLARAHERRRAHTGL